VGRRAPLGTLSSTYRELPPPRHLAASVACLWVREVDAAGTHVVLPDGCIDIVASSAGVLTAGPDTGPVPSALRPGDTIVGVRFRPGAAAPVLGWPANELRDQRIPVEELDGVKSFRAALEVGAARKDLTPFVDAVARRLRDAPPPDPVVQQAIAELAGGARVSELPARLFLSERQLRRRFHASVGYGPKVFERVLRLQRLLALAPATPGGLARLAAEAGYADHAHMAAECARLTGLAPSALLEVRFPQAEEPLAA
jgi:AraC-like DNA-binding protein